MSTSKAAERLVIEFGRAVHRYGAPAHRLEEALVHLSRGLGLKGEFFSTPTSLIAAFEGGHTTLVRVDPGDIDLEKLALLDGVVDDVVLKQVSPEEALARVQAIVEAPPPHGPLAIAVAHGLAAGGAARFFTGGAREIATAAVIGLVLGALSVVLSRSVSANRAYPLVASFLASILAAASSWWLGGAAQVATLAGLIVLVPGLTLTVAMAELATRNLVSGTARLMAAGIVFLEIGLGVALGETVSAALFESPPAVTTIAPAAWTEGLALVFSSVGVTMLFQARLSRLPVIVAACFLSFWGARLGAQLFGPALGVFLGAFGVALASNLYARLPNRSALVTLVPALLLLVPGSLGYRSLTSLLHRDTLAGVETATSMFVVAAAIVGGLLMANLAAQPRRSF